MQLTENSPAEVAQAVGRGTPPAGLRPDLELHGLIGPGVAVEGTLSFAGRVRIEGIVNGNILGGELVVIGAPARISGRISARQVIVLGGEVHADISADELIELRVPAVVVGDLVAPEIFLDRGIEFQGTCSMTPVGR